jgi:hypothetical protein
LSFFLKPHWFASSSTFADIYITIRLLDYGPNHFTAQKYNKVHLNKGEHLMKPCGCGMPRQKTFFKKVTKTSVTKVKFVPKVEKFSFVDVECGVITKHRRKKHHHHNHHHHGHHHHSCSCGRRY